ncbi:MAG: hypothetical protein HDQ98_16685 [Lachnospiraceae bacterium]|nr:hypothetical protein [Lachnospiraceae bacterium]
MRRTFLRGKCMLLLLSVLLTGCGKPTAGSARESERFTARSIVLGCYSESGILYEKDGILCFVDYATGEDVVLCTKPNCAHIPYSAVNNPDPYCDAALPWDAFIETMIYGDKLYALVTNFDSTFVYEKGVSESEWKKLAEIPYSYYQTVKWIACNDQIYYVANQYERQEGTLELENAIFLAYVDLTDGTYGSFTDFDEDIGTIIILYVDEKNLYYEMDYKLDVAVPEDKGWVYRMDLDTRESEPVFRVEENKRFAAMYGEDLYYFENGDLHRVDDGGTDTCIYRGTEIYPDAEIASSGIIVSYYDKDTGDYTIIYVDYESGMIQEIERPKSEGPIVDIVGENALVFGDVMQVIRLTDFLAGKDNYIAQHEIP